MSYQVTCLVFHSPICLTCNIVDILLIYHRADISLTERVFIWSTIQMTVCEIKNQPYIFLANFPYKLKVWFDDKGKLSWIVTYWNCRLVEIFQILGERPNNYVMDSYWYDVIFLNELFPHTVTWILFNITFLDTY